MSDISLIRNQIGLPGNHLGKWLSQEYKSMDRRRSIEGFPSCYTKQSLPFQFPLYLTNVYPLGIILEAKLQRSMFIVEDEKLMQVQK